MSLDAELLELLACPSDDHAPLREDVRDGDPVLVCTHCASVFRDRRRDPGAAARRGDSRPAAGSAGPPRATDRPALRDGPA